MSRILLTRARALAQFAAPVLLASVLGACSSMPDWVDPTGWFGSDSQASSDQSGGASADATQVPDNGNTPDLASIPPKPTPPSTPDEQQQVANSLTADRSQAQYSAEALQGGTEPVAAPPPPASADSTATPAPAATADNAPSSSTDTADTSASSAAAPENASQPSATADSPATQVASTESPATTAPAAATMATATSSAPPATNASGFAPSHAPALDPSVVQYVPQRILSRYQQTAAAAAVPGVEGMSTGNAAKSAHRRKAKAAQTEPAADTTAPAQ